MLILAVDPGLLSGYVYYSTDLKESTIDQDEIEPYDMCHYIDQIASSGQCDAIVCEAYIITPQTIKKTRQNYSLEIIGVAKYLSQLHNVHLEMQTPRDAKGFMTDEKLKTLGFWVPGHDHIRDAYRHLGLYLAKKGNRKILDA